MAHTSSSMPVPSRIQIILGSEEKIAVDCLRISQRVKTHLLIRQPLGL